MKKYLVTGGAGFIGSNFILYILRKHEDIKVLNVDKLTYAGNLENLNSICDDARYEFSQTDICDSEEINKLICEFDPDYVINFAAESHVDRSIENPSIFAHSNVIGTCTLLDAVKKHWDKGNNGFGDHKYLQVSTDEVYGSLSLDEPDSFFYETTPLSPHSPYSASKASADFFVKAYHDTFGLPINITRCSNNYGPFQFPEKLIPLIINNCLDHKDLPLYGDGLNIRDWLYVDDHCKAIDMVARDGKVGEVYNIGGHNERSNIYIVKKIIEEVSNAVSDKDINESLIKHVGDRAGHDRRYGIAPNKIKEDLGWYPETSFEVGIVKTIKWYLDNKEWMDHVTNGEYLNYYKKMYSNR